MESADNKEEVDYSDSKFRQEIHSKVIRAGKRTYFFDVKSTRNDEYYLTITESKKRFDDNGKFNYEKHKIFLYKEDFEKFIGSLQEVFDFIYSKQPKEDRGDRAVDVTEKDGFEENEPIKKYTNVEFEDI